MTTSERYSGVLSQTTRRELAALVAGQEVEMCSMLSRYIAQDMGYMVAVRRDSFGRAFHYISNLLFDRYVKESQS